jgi:hypothetical protein
LQGVRVRAGIGLAVYRLYRVFIKSLEPSVYAGVGVQVGLQLRVVLPYVPLLLIKNIVPPVLPAFKASRLLYDVPVSGAKESAVLNP